MAHEPGHSYWSIPSTALDFSSMNLAQGNNTPYTLQTVPMSAGAGSTTTPELTAFGQNGYFAPLAQGVGSLVNAYTAYRTLGLAEDNLDFQKGAFKDQLARLDQDYRNQLEHQYRRQNLGNDIKAKDLQRYIDRRTV